MCTRLLHDWPTLSPAVTGCQRAFSLWRYRSQRPWTLLAQHLSASPGVAFIGTSGGSRQQHDAAHARTTGSKLHATAPAAPSTAASDVFADESASFAGLGLDARVVEAAQAAGFQRPTKVQALVVPTLLSGQDVVLAAETGSGKTLSYLLPILSDLLQRNAMALPAQEEQEGANGVARRLSPGALVLCPNATLCEQVLRVFRSLQTVPATQGLTAAWLSNANPPPQHCSVDVAIATPAALLNLLYGTGMYYGYEWSPLGLAARMVTVVMDEADLLLGGGYERDTRRLMTLLRGADREAKGNALAAEMGVPGAAFRNLPRHVRVAGLQGGLRDAREAGLTDAMLQRAQQLAAQQAQEGGGPALDPRSEARGPAPPAPALDGPRQYVFVGATMPEATKKSVGAELRAWFPAAAWVSGERLHRALEHTRHEWRRVDAGGELEELLEVIRSQPDLAAGAGRVLVFTRDVAAAVEAAELLREARVPKVVLFHSKSPAAARAEALQRMASEEGVVMVCTDAAARGLDVPSITHVVQAGFATNAVDFLHRVGRTGRAGQPGRVTSIHGPEAEDLVNAIRLAMERGQPVEKAFSRKRGFRKKVGRYGVRGTMESQVPEL